MVLSKRCTAAWKASNPPGSNIRKAVCHDFLASKRDAVEDDEKCVKITRCWRTFTATAAPFQRPLYTLPKPPCPSRGPS